jgi:hypothetical protein
MTTMPTFASPDIIEAETIPQSGVKRLGAVRGQTYATTSDGRELRIGKPLAEFELANPVRPSEVRVVREKRVPAPGLESQRTVLVREFIRAFVVEPGTFERQLARDKASAERKARAEAAKATPHYVDLAEFLPVLSRAEAQFVATGGTDPALGRLSQRSALIAVPGREPVRGPAILEWVQARGVDLADLGEHLSVKATKLDPATAEVIRTFHALLHGWVAKRPKPCAARGHNKPEPAFTLAVGGLPVCERHLTGELEVAR